MNHEALKLAYGKPKGKEKTRKQNELGFQEVVVILSPLSLYGGNRKTKLPLLHNRRYTSRRALWEYIGVAPSDR
jgi:hypothetical protein